MKPCTLVVSIPDFTHGTFGPASSRGSRGDITYWLVPDEALTKELHGLLEELTGRESCEIPVRRIARALELLDDAARATRTAATEPGTAHIINTLPPEHVATRLVVVNPGLRTYYESLSTDM